MASLLPGFVMMWSIAVNNTELCNETNGRDENETWIAPGESVVFSSPNFPSSYGSDAKDWVFCAADADGRLEIDCGEFEVGWKFFFCFNDLFLISADSSLKFMYCGEDGPQSVITTERGTAICLIPSGTIDSKGFNCTVTAFPPSLDEETTTPTN
ncbi:uncharacterized protein LOC119584446 [Penaeus monodon]|uniref:uncharacterized protein LOC119584446 n=1 Tax=Penaeus monodon TaxID=6687 RepID=UPI0018A73E28|nr:uncharacterized protein LOC119584446 [Penaeus monodon]